MSKRIAIIGAGLSGLATAAQLRLADPALELSVFDSRDRTGGVIHSERADGFIIDHGADMFALNPPGVIDLCRQIGIDDRLIVPETTNQGARIVSGGKLVPVPEGFVLMRATKLAPMLKTPLLSWAGKARFLCERWIRPRAESDSSDESIGSFVRRRMGQEVLDRLVAPLAAGIYTGDIDKLSMGATMAPIAQLERQYGSLARARSVRLKSGEDSAERSSAGARYAQFRSFEGGMVELIEGLTKTIPPETLHLRTPVDSIKKVGTSWEVRTGGPQPNSASFDHLVITTPAHVTAALLRQEVPEAASNLEQIESASTAIVTLGVRRSDIAADVSTFGFVVPPIEQRRILAGSFASHKFANRAPKDHVLVRVFIGGTSRPDLLDHTDERLVEIAREELAELIGLSGTSVVQRVIRWNQAMPQYHIGHRERARSIIEAVDSVGGLSIASNALGGVGIAAVVQMAGQAAEKALQTVGSIRQHAG